MNELNNLKCFLCENEIEFKDERYGNSLYFNDGFSVSAVVVTFPYDLIASENYREEVKKMDKKKKLLQGYLRRRKNLVIGYSGTCAICTQYFALFKKEDYHRLSDHENRIKVASEEFWKSRKSQTVCSSIDI